MIAAVNKVLIIGGGFSGMTAAIQLARRGIEVDLVEIDPLWCPLGAGITLSGPTLRALDTIGILERVASEGYLSKDFDVFSPAGELIVQLATRSPVSSKPIPGGGGILRRYWRGFSPTRREKWALTCALVLPSKPSSSTAIASR